jgi:hypothetical protein
MVEKKYRTVGVTYKLNEGILEPKDDSVGKKARKINSLLSEKFLEDPNHRYIIRELAVKGEVTTQNLQKALKMPFKAAVSIVRNLESLGLVTLDDYTGPPPNQSWRLEDEFAKLAMMKKERIVKSLYEEKENYNELVEWIKTSKGKDWLDFQADEKGWLHTSDGKTWLNSKDGKTWLKTTEAGAKYKQFSKNIEEQPKIIKKQLNYQHQIIPENVWEVLKRTSDPSSSSYITLINEEEADKALKDLTISVRDTSKILENIYTDTPSEIRENIQIDTPKDKTVKSIERPPPHKNYMLSESYSDRNWGRGFNQIKGIISRLPAKYRDHPAFTSVIETLWDGYEISVDQLQRDNPYLREGLQGSYSADTVIDILKNLDIIENKTHTPTTTWSGSQGRIQIENPNSLLFDRNPFVQKIGSKNSKYTPKKGEQETYGQFFEDGRFKNYNQFLTWLKTPYGQEFLTDQVNIRGWLDTPDGIDWQKTYTGEEWLEDTAYGREYKGLRDPEDLYYDVEPGEKFYNPLWDMYETDQKDISIREEESTRKHIEQFGKPPTGQELIDKQDADKALEDFSTSGRDISEIRQEAIEAGHNLPSEERPAISVQGEPTQAQQIPRRIEDLSKMYRLKGKVGRWLPKPLTRPEQEKLLESLERRESPQISAEKFSEYKKYLQLRTNENWQESPLGQEILEFIEPHLIKGLRITGGINRPVKILSDWRNKAGRDKPQGIIIQGDIDQSKWAEPQVYRSSSGTLRIEPSNLINSIDFYNLEALKTYRGLIGEKIKQHHLSKTEKPFWDFLEYNAAKVQGLIDLVDNIKAGNDYFEGPIGTTTLEIPPRGARYFTPTPIPKRGKYEPGPSEINVSNSYMQLRELFGNAFGMDKNALDTEIYDYSKYGGSRAQIEFLRAMGLVEYVNFRYKEVLHIDATTRPKDYYVDALGRPRWFPPGATDGESLALEPNIIIPINGDIRYAKNNLPSTAVIRYKKTTRKRTGEYPTDRVLKSGDPAKGRPQYRQYTKMYELVYDKKITPAGRKAAESIIKALFPDFTKKDQLNYTRRALSLISEANFKHQFPLMQSITGISPETIGKISSRESKQSSVENLESSKSAIQTSSPKWEIPNKEAFLRKVFQEYISDEQKIIEKRKKDPSEFLTELGKKQLEIKINPETFAERVRDKIPKVRELIRQSGKEIKIDFLDNISEEDAKSYWNNKEIINKETGRINPINIDKLMQPMQTIFRSGVSVPVLEVKSEKSFISDPLTYDELKQKMGIMRRLKIAYKNSPEQLERISSLTNTDIKQIIGMGKGGRSDVEAYQAIVSAEKDPTLSPQVPQRKTISDIRAADVDNTARTRYTQQGLVGEDLEAAINDHYARIAERYDTVVQMAETAQKAVTSFVPVGKTAKMSVPVARKILEIIPDPVFQQLIAGDEALESIVNEAQQSWSSGIRSIIEDEEEEEVPIGIKPLDDNNMSQGGFVTL